MTSSNQFFQELQDEVRTGIREKKAALNKHKNKKQGVSAAKLKLW